MIEDTNKNRDRVCELMADSMDIEALLQFVHETLYESMIKDDKQFRNLLDHLGVETQGELDGDDCPVIGGSPLPEDIDEIKHTYDNCHKLAEESARATDLKDLQEFYRISMFERMLNDQKAFEDELDNLNIKTQEELDGDE